MINQIKKILPRSEWSKVLINESNEPLVEMEETSRIKINLVKKSYRPILFVRKSVYEKIIKVSEILFEGINLVLIEGYRTLESQQKSWDTKFQKLKLENPTWVGEQIEQQVCLVVARPTPLTNHHCGGAIDVTLAFSDGTLLDMGTPYPSEAMSADWYKKFPMFSNEITKKQKDNRQILRKAMETEAFVWYPGEWWHYCWGDRMWAVYSNQTECFYGPVEVNISRKSEES
jgi:zinc D-Ala-D-Ala dipeptidase